MTIQLISNEVCQPVNEHLFLEPCVIYPEYSMLVETQL
jgi:hypothetical protein